MEELVVSKMDNDFKYEIAARPGAGYFSRCFSCGTCTASCPVSEIDEAFNPRLIIRQALMGNKKELLSSRELWLCTQCYTCYARCPQDVRFTDIVAALREMAVEEGLAAESMLEKSEKVGLLIQKVRRDLSENLWKSENGAAVDNKEVTKILTEGMKELGL